MKLKPGDVVILKSGGQPLTVAEVSDDAVECLWMGAAGDLFRETLPLAVLESADIDPLDREDDEEEEDEDEEDDERADEEEEDKVA
ncbi:YodC family protein [Bradyrhizobium sp.]|jgi:uncharacterized protein YodC (DUF2158 family)|uniref:YodC family protein n=1 Tax=Bradyrhizobium sp. TaxID=376 RepID=UPI002CFFFD07|nr:DUF2158 domain-containing protein [Bradyrhizobium sp.]HWX63255.1 DUF2158 domain-containing protein [Bradyrhizobium sp.]